MEKVARKDIESASDVESFVREFYTKVYRDEVLRPVFEDVARVDLAEHLPKMNRFWATVLLDEGSYHGQPLKAHLNLNRMVPLHDCHFLRWQSLFCQTIDGLFAGPRAEKAKDAARRINKSIAWNLEKASATGWRNATDLLP